MNPVLKFSFFAVMLIYLWFPYQMISSNELLLEEGLLYKFKSTPVDPYDAFRGRYVALNLDLNPVKNQELAETMRSNDVVYVQIELDSAGYAYLANAFENKPDFENYIKARVAYIQQEELVLRMPENLSRYYMNEKLAPLAEEYYRKLSNQNQSPGVVDVHLNVRLSNGDAIIEELYFKEQPVGEFIREEMAEQ